jgi:xylulokinase
VYEGIAFGIRQILEIIDADAVDVTTRLVAVGGGTEGGLWTQVVSDVCGREQQVPATTIGASYGDALLAAMGTGTVPAGTDWARIERTVSPNPSTRELYDRLYRAYGELYPATRAHMHLLASMQRSEPTSSPVG